MPIASDTIETIKKFAKYQQAIIDFAEAYKDMESFNQAFNETENRIRDKRAEEAELDTLLAKMKKQVADANAKEQAAKDRAANIIADAQTLAAQRLDDARAKAALAIADAADQAKSTIKEGADKLRQVNLQIQEKQAEAKQIDELIASRMLEHTDIEKKIENAKAKISKMLGV